MNPGYADYMTVRNTPILLMIMDLNQCQNMLQWNDKYIAMHIDDVFIMQKELRLLFYYAVYCSSMINNIFL